MKRQLTPNSQPPTPKGTCRALLALGVGSWKLGVVSLVIVCAVAGLSAQRPVLSTQQILEQLERDWVTAMQRNDVDFVNSVLAPEFVATYDDGSRGDRVRELQLAKEFNGQVDKWAVDEFTVRVFNETAVVWFTLRMVGPVKEVPTEIVLRYMDVFVNRDGKWLCIGSQSTKVTAK
jgi:uncharacterized protein DUF4440